MVKRVQEVKMVTEYGPIERQSRAGSLTSHVLGLEFVLRVLIRIFAVLSNGREGLRGTERMD